MEKRLYRLTMVVWRNCQDTDTDYIKDFSTLEDAIDFANKNKQELLQESLFYDECQAVDIDIEEWHDDDCVGVVWSTELWAKKEQREKNFLESIKNILEKRVHNYDDFVKVYNHRHEMFDDQEIIHYFEDACEDYAKEKGWDLEWALDKGLARIRGQK